MFANIAGLFGESKELEATKAENEKLKQELAKAKQQQNGPNIVQINIVNNQNTLNQQQINNKVTTKTTNKLASKNTVGGNAVLKNKRFALCGKLSKTQKEFEAIIIRNGGNIVNEVDKNTDYMLVGNEIGGLPNNSKANNAQKFQIPILKEQWMLDVDAKNKWVSVTKKYKFDSTKAIALENKVKAKPIEEAPKKVAKTKSISGTKRKLADCEEKGKTKAIKEPLEKKAKLEVVTKLRSNIFKAKYFALCGALSKTQSEIKQTIEENGGKVVSKIDAATSYVVIGNNVKKLPETEKSKEAKGFKIPFVREQFVYDCVGQQKLKNVTKKYKYEQ